MNSSPLGRFLPLVALLLCGAAAECAPPDDGLPVGAWRKETIADNSAAHSIFTSTVSITSDGRGHWQHTYLITWKFGRQIGYGKFAGRTRLSWTIAADARKTARVGDEIYMYPDPAGKTRLLGGDPPGYSLEDYQSMGGTISPQERNGWAIQNSIDIFKIQGRDLLLLDSEDKKQYLFKRVK